MRAWAVATISLGVTRGLCRNRRTSPARSPPSGRTRTPFLADRKKTVEKERPPFPSDGRQTAPACVPFRFLRHSLTARESETAPRRKADTARRSVHVVGSRPGIMGLSAVRDFGLSPSGASQIKRNHLIDKDAAQNQSAAGLPLSARRACRDLRPRSAAWHHQREASFSDATAAVRRLFWSAPNLSMSRHDPDGVEIPAALGDRLGKRSATRHKIRKVELKA